MKAAADGADAAISGVPLAQYAAVTAALAEAYALKAVLATEGLDAASWAAADSGWTTRLAEDAALLAVYEKALASAADRLARTVEPIDEDLSAWVAFLAALGREPQALLEQHGISHDDVARLRRMWDERMLEDPALQRRAAELARNPGELPPLRLVKAKLRRSRVGLAIAKAASPGVAAPLPRSAHVELASASRSVAGARAPAPPPTKGTGDAGTKDVVAPSLPTPFRGAPSSQFLDALRGPAARPGDGSDGETVDVFLPTAETPFTAAAAGGSTARSGSRTQPLPALPGDGSDGETVDVFVAASELVDDSTVAISPAVSAPASVPLPFRAGSPRVFTPATPRPRIGPQPALPKIYGDEPVVETVTTVLVPGAKALPFEPPPDAAEPGDAAAPPRSFQPALSLEQHAALCLEIAVDPTHTDEALARYHLSIADKARLDELYRTRMTADPKLRAQWNGAFEAHRVWFSSRPRP